MGRFFGFKEVGGEEVSYAVFKNIVDPYTGELPYRCDRHAFTLLENGDEPAGNAAAITDMEEQNMGRSLRRMRVGGFRRSRLRKSTRRSKRRVA
jgi:hypothetical protein